MRSLVKVLCLLAALPLAFGDVEIQGKGSTFIVSYDPLYKTEHREVMNQAAQFWADWVVSDVPIRVQAIASNYQFGLPSGWGEASETIRPEAVINFPNAPLANTYYPIALANSLAKTDLNPNGIDIIINYEEDSLGWQNIWYFPIGALVPDNLYSLYYTTLQEIAHGLGLIALGDIKNGEKYNGKNDIYWTKIFSLSHNKPITELSAAQIKRAFLEDEKFGYFGERALAESGHLRWGLENNTLLLWGDRNKDILTGNHFSHAVFPRQLMSVDIRYKEPEIDITLAMLEDIGWRTMRNSAPVIQGQRSISINEDHSYDISLADLTIVDEAVNELSLTIADGSNYQRSGNRITPAANFHGTLTVPVTVADTQFSSNTYNLAITVNSVNDAPSIIQQQALSVSEDKSLTLNTSHFTINDVDSSSFSLSVSSGSHYSVSGTKITPAANYHGELSVTVKASDGYATSAAFTTKITVNPVNDAPSISSQKSLSVDEDQTLSLTASQFTISDVDSSSFSLQLFAGNNYTVNGNSLTPKNNFNGTLTVPVRVSDGNASSALFNASVTVNAVNDAPIITQQLSLTTAEETALTLTTSQFTLADVDSNSFSLQVSSGQNYTLAGNTVTPSKDFTGSITVPVKVSDGDKWSNLFNTLITVTEVNDAPVVTAQQTISSDEDKPFTLGLSHFTIQDSDSSTFSLELLAGDNYQFNGTTVTPNENFNGHLNINLRVNDGISNSAIYSAQATVNAVNDAPLITSQNEISILEDHSLAIQLSDLKITDVDSESFSLTVFAGEHYSIDANTLMPEENFNGLLQVPVKINDGSLDSEPFTLAITVTPVNDAPVLFAPTAITLNEDEAITLTPNLFEFNDVDSETFTVIAQGGEHYSIKSNALNSQIIPNRNFNGEINIPVQISDGDASSNSRLLTIEYLAVNDAPEVLSVAAQSIYEDGSLFVSKEMLDVFDPDNADYDIHITRGEHYQVAGLEIIPDENWFGQLSIELQVDDGELTSNSLPLVLDVVAVNDVPVMTTAELNHAQIYRNWQTQLTAEDVENETLTFSAVNLPSWVQLSEQGLLSSYPNENMIGEHSLEIAVSDGIGKTSSTLVLTVLDDPTATNLSTALTAERTIWATDAWVPVSLTLHNHGPMSSVASVVELEFNGLWQTQDKRCEVAENRCTLEVQASETIELAVQQSELGSQNLTANVSHEGYDFQLEDNASQITFTFSDTKPTQPQYTVPAFGKGDVRAIGLANIQGGRWPEILFANGPTQASTAYKFDGSLFRPVLHSHLGDASDSNAMAVFDFDNDGDKDWVLANGNNEGNTLYRNDGDGFFTYIGSLGAYDSRAVAYADLDRDGDKDLVFANNDQPNTLYLNNGNGEFELFAEFESRRSCRVIIHDFNGDGRPDIFFANRGFRHRILFNRGFSRSRANFKTAATEPTSPIAFGAMDFGDPTDLASEAMLADLDGDGVASDLVLANEASSEQPASIKVFAIDRNESAQVTASIETAAITDLSTGDFDGDGIDDIAVLRPGGALEVMQPRQGSLHTSEVMDTDGADTILMVDVDGSGKADIISANNKSESARLDFAGDVDHSVEGTALEAPENSANADAPNANTPSDSTSLQLSVNSAGALNVWLLFIPLLMRFRRKRN